MKISEPFELLKDTFSEWTEDKAPRLGAALAYYSIFSIAPLLVIAVAVAGLVFGEDAAQGKLVDEIKGTVGEPMALALQQLLANASKPGWGTGAGIIGIVLLLFGAAGVFVQMQDALNTIWKVEPKPGRGVWGIIQDRFPSFMMVLGTGIFLVAALVVTTGLSAIHGSIGDAIPGGPVLWQWVNQIVFFALITLLFAMLYRFVPDAHVAWRDVWIGAALTALLFTIGKFLLGWYLGRGSVTSPYGAAGSLVVILLWVYYSAQILLFGAEFTRVYAERYGSGVEPTSNAIFVSDEARARQGMGRGPYARTKSSPQGR